MRFVLVYIIGHISIMDLKNLLDNINNSDLCSLSNTVIACNFTLLQEKKLWKFTIRWNLWIGNILRGRVKQIEYIKDMWCSTRLLSLNY